MLWKLRIRRRFIRLQVAIEGLLDWPVALRDVIRETRAELLYGPDLASWSSRKMPHDAVAKITVTNWSDQAFRLLPRRYELILEGFFAEGLLSQEEHVAAAQLAKRVILLPRDKPIWVKKPKVLADASDSLKKQVAEFSKDRQKLQSCLKGIRCLRRSIRYSRKLSPSR